MAIKMPLETRKAKVGIDDLPTFEAQITGQTWNGWETPYFKEDVVWEIAENDDYPEVTYDEESGCFTSPCPFDGDPYQWPVTEIDGETYHGIGQYMWTWDVEDLDDHPWRGDFSRSAWIALGAVEAALWPHTYQPQVSDFHQDVCHTRNIVESEAKLRRIISSALDVRDEYEIELSTKLWADLREAANGGNPWASDGAD